MDFGLYVVDVWGGPLGHSTAADPRWCTLSGVAKVNSPKSPYAVADEFLCGRLALMIGLPAPPGIVVSTDAGEPAYVALRFGKQGERPPPAIPKELAEDNPFVAAGVVAFDCWVGNSDRHSLNIAYSRGIVPVTVFDHERALLGHEAGKGIDRLNSLEDKPHIVGCLPPFLKASSDLRTWADRIGAIPDGLIDELCRTVGGPGGITPDEARAAGDFLRKRKGTLFALFEAGKACLPNVKDW
jgi:hypothetical protein